MPILNHMNYENKYLSEHFNFLSLGIFSSSLGMGGWPPVLIERAGLLQNQIVMYRWAVWPEDREA